MMIRRPLPTLLPALFSVFLLAAVPAAAGEAIRGPIPAQVLKIIDGDTLKVRAVIWPGTEVVTNVRMDGLDTPETRSKCAAEKVKANAAIDALRKMAGTGVQLVQVQPDKYGNRVRARVLTAKGEDIGAALIKAGLARAYQGGKRLPWCGKGA